ncbi:hypothetical protein L484_026049 [Morus notabilis]|uniref:Pentacotripeptide-repeat region of PRORP domain-containing protein n=1 Tax=Morus notabilis TaxID=981085 RepID=W9R7W3_9ROSA|nr:hypothetical protein L484_026049 [Morus notabilis]
MAIRSVVVKLRPEAAYPLWRSLRSYAGPSIRAVDEEFNTKTKSHELEREILKLKYPRDCATTVLRSSADNGYKVSFLELRRFSVRLLKLKRHNHALQIMEWLEGQRRFQMSPADHAVKMELIIKVKGLMEAEDYFQNVSDTASLKVACCPLLRGYVEGRDTEKAEAFMAKLNGLGLIVSPHLCNQMMKLYMATSQFGKMLLVIQEMKRNRIPLNVMSYNLWMNACGEISKVESVEMVYAEMMRDSGVEIGWGRWFTQR